MDPEEILRALETSARDLSSRFVALGGRGGVSYPRARRAPYGARMMERDWAGLAALGVADAAVYDRDVPALAELQAAVTGGAALHDQLMAAFPPRWVTPAHRANWDEHREGFSEQLRALGATPDAIAASVALLGRIGKRELKHQFRRVHDGAADDLDDLVVEQLAFHMAGRLAAAVARFNLLVAAPQPGPDLERFVIDELVRARAAERAVWEALRLADPVAIRDRAAELIAGAEAALEQAITGAAVVAARRAAPAPVVADDGRLACALADRLRDALAAIALGRRVSWIAGFDPEAPQLRAWLRAAALPFTDAYRSPIAVTIAQLADDPARWAGQDLRVEGVLGEIQNRRKARGTIASAPLRDPDGRAATIAIAHLGLDSGGAVPGAWVEASGTWRLETDGLTGPALLVDRRNLGREQRTSWRAWAAAQLRASFDPVPHGLALRWSWEPGPDGAGNPLRHGVWYLDGSN